MNHEVCRFQSGCDYGVVRWSHAGDDADVYCKDGQLRATLLLRQAQGGAAGFTGQEVKIGTDGKWTLSQLVGKKSTLKMKGTLKQGKRRASASM